jgi:DNA-binding MarR family transcriptional regulator
MGYMKKRKKKTIKRHKKVRKQVKRRKGTVKKHRRRIKKHRRAAKAVRAYIGKGILEQLFESQAKVKLMKFFLRNASDNFQLKDILKMLRVNSSALRQEMKKLERIDLIKKKKVQGRRVFYLNLNFDFIKELKDLVLKSTISSKGELMEDIRKTGNIKLLALAGIFKGNNDTEADLLVVGDKVNQRKFSTFLKDLEAEVGKELKCVLMSSKEFNYRYDMYDRFVRDLISENSDVLINKLNLW